MIRNLLIALLCVTLLGACSMFDKPRAGTATDAENTVAALVVDSVGAGVAGAEVRLVTDSLGWSVSRVLAKTAVVRLDSSGNVRTTFTDSLGKFSFEAVDSTDAFSLCLQYADAKGVLHAGLHKGMRLANFNSDSLSKIVVPKASVLVGSLTYLGSSSSLYQFSDHFRIGIEGAGITLSVLAGRPFVLDGIPAGMQNVIVYPADQFLLQSLLNAGVPLDSLVRRVQINFPEGDTIFANGLEWSLPKSYAWLYQDSLVQKMRRMSGVVVNYLGDPVEDVEVRLITDSLGFTYPGDFIGFPKTDSSVAHSDSTGTWWLPVPSASSFSLEFLKRNKNDSLVGVGILRSISKLSLTDTLIILDTVTLEMPATLRGMVLYTEEPGAWIRIGDHFRVGIKGTSRYTDVVVGDTFDLKGLPSGPQMLVEYPGDNFLWPTFSSALGSLDAMVQGTTFVVFTPGTTQQMQVQTYSLPTP